MVHDIDPDGLEMQLAEVEQHLDTAMIELSAASMTLTGMMLSCACAGSDKLRVLAELIATHKHLISGVADLVRQVPRAELDACPALGEHRDENDPGCTRNSPLPRLSTHRDLKQRRGNR